MQRQIVSHEQWAAAREQVLTEEKQLTRMRDKVNARRRELPWVKIEKDYVFDGPNGKETLADLFAGPSQLVVRHFMFGPGWEEGCVGCSFWSDHLGGALPHLEHRVVTVVVVSRAPSTDCMKTAIRTSADASPLSCRDCCTDYHSVMETRGMCLGC